MDPYAAEMAAHAEISGIIDLTTKRFSTEYLADGERNWESKSLDNGAQDANAAYFLHQRHGLRVPARLQHMNVAIQRWSHDLTLRGLWMLDNARKDDAGRNGHAYLRRALKLMEWALNRQEANGGWERAVSFEPNEAAKAWRLMHNTSYFVTHSALTLMLIRESPYSATHEARVAPCADGVWLAAKWMLNRRMETGPHATWLDSANASDDDFAHRWFLKGCALAFAGRMVGASLGTNGGKPIMEQAVEQVIGGMERQVGSALRPTPPERPQDEDAFQEKMNGTYWGVDTGYHSDSLRYGLYFALKFPNYFGRADLMDSMGRGVAWLKGRMDPDGYIHHEGNTRTCAGETNDFGQQKTPHYDSTSTAFSLWSVLASSPDDAELARTVARYAAEHPREELCDRT